MGLGFIGSNHWGLTKSTFQKYLNSNAAEQIDQTLENNLLVFATISTIKAAVALIEGSSMGVGVELEVGDLVQPAYDYIDFVWRLFLYAILLMTFYKLLFESGVLGVGFQILGLGLLLWGLSQLWPSAKADIRLWAK